MAMVQSRFVYNQRLEIAAVSNLSSGRSIDFRVCMAIDDDCGTAPLGSASQPHLGFPKTTPREPKYFFCLTLLKYWLSLLGRVSKRSDRARAGRMFVSFYAESRVSRTPIADWWPVVAAARRSLGLLSRVSTFQIRGSPGGRVLLKSPPTYTPRLFLWG